MRVHHRAVPAILATWLSLAWGADAAAQNTNWNFAASEDQILNCSVPPYPAVNDCALDGSTDSAASATAHFSYDATMQMLSYDVIWNGLEGDLVSMHVHGPATPAQNNTRHIFDVFAAEIDVFNANVDRRDDRFSGSVFIAASSMDLADLTAGNAYLNVHTVAFVHGEIRGNLPEPHPGVAAVVALLPLLALRRRGRVAAGEPAPTAASTR